MGLIERNNVDFISVSFSSGSSKSTLDTATLGNKTTFMQMTLSVQGSRQSVNALVADMENFPRIINIKRIAMTPRAEGGLIDGTEVKADIETEFYFYEQ